MILSQSPVHFIGAGSTTWERGTASAAKFVAYSSRLGVLVSFTSKFQALDYTLVLMQLFIDLHCHSRFSADGVAEPEALVREARAKGFHGFAITDHNTCACVDYFLQNGYMNKEGLPVDGLLIIPGQEITTAEGHLLALGITLPDLKGIPAIEAVALIHQAGGLAIPPHPYDFFRAGIREPVLETLDIDAVEVFNAATTLKRYNKHAFSYAQGAACP